MSLKSLYASVFRLFFSSLTIASIVTCIVLVFSIGTQSLWGVNTMFITALISHLSLELVSDFCPCNWDGRWSGLTCIPTYKLRPGYIIDRVGLYSKLILIFYLGYALTATVAAAVKWAAPGPVGSDLLLLLPLSYAMFLAVLFTLVPDMPCVGAY